MYIESYGISRLSSWGFFSLKLPCAEGEGQAWGKAVAARGGDQEGSSLCHQQPHPSEAQGPPAVLRDAPSKDWEAFRAPTPVPWDTEPPRGPLLQHRAGTAPPVHLAACDAETETLRKTYFKILTFILNIKEELYLFKFFLNHSYDSACSISEQLFFPFLAPFPFSY